MTNKLRLKILLGIALILGFFLLVLGVYVVDSQKQQLIENLRDHGNRIASLAARSSAEYIQRFSFFLMEDQAISIERSPQIAFCEIYDAEGVSLLQSGNIISKDHIGKHRPQYGDNILIVSQPIVANDTVLGHVEIGLRLDSIEKAIQRKTIHLVVLFTLFTVCVIGALSLFFQKVFINPVLQIADVAQRVAVRDFATIDVGERTDEIGLLARNFNQMSQALEGLYADLEGSVVQRTRELEQVNADLRGAIEHARELAQKAEAGTVAKSQFLAAMSHEIRTPMNAVLGMGEILSESGLNGEQRQYMNILLESGKALLNLIDDILDLSKIEAGEMVFESTPFDMEEVVDKVFKVTSYAGHQKGLDLEYILAPDVPPWLCGDPVRLQQILINLLGNGIKFTETGRVLLEISTVSEPDVITGETLRVQFCIRDSGVGVEPDKQATIFETFTQADASTTRRYGGTGLGLSICRSLCEMLGGTIWLESQVGRGSSVYFILPFLIPDDIETPPSVLAGRPFLLIDDREYTERALASRMRRVGAQVETLVSLDTGSRGGHQVVNFKRAYDAVLVNVPVQGGAWESTANALVADGFDPKKILLLAANGARHRAAMSGYGAVLPKPVCVAELEAVMAGKVITQPPAHAGRMRPSAWVREPLSILLMEDSATNSMLIELYLKGTGHRLLVAQNGEEGLACFKDEVVDVIFMDVEMPIMDGLTCTRAIREWERSNRRKPVRIVALTAHALSEVREKVFSAGCDTYLTKPIRRETFLKAIYPDSNG